MKTTVKIQPNKAVQVVDSGKSVTVNLQTFGMTALSFELTPDMAEVLGSALMTSAASAAQFSRSL